ncbi:polysaccharide deacetylase family protein [Pedobacter steynii]|nr:polysaccharide deacetylase family protein [Pedobacter steynii]NQX40292.1 polysaccharide deacetylase family protein [Pedobacter steynii]
MKSNVTIVMYHYVRDLANSRYPEIKGLDLPCFVNQIEYLNKHYNVITTEELIHSIDTGESLPPKSALLTFDDGYIDHYTNVFPILSNYGIQGSFYIPVKAIKEHVVLDVNKIHFILASTPDKLMIVKDLEHLLEKYRTTYQLYPFDHYYDMLAKASRYDSKEVIFIKRLLQVELIEELRLKIVEELFVKYVGMEEHVFAKELYMTEDQLIHMQNSGMHIGSHGFNHYWWNHLNEKDLASELDLSMSFLHDIGVDMKNWTACYPYGSFDEQAVRMLSSRGCKMAVTTQVDVAEPIEKMRFLLPRLDTNDLPKEKNSTINDWYKKAI